MACSFSGRRRCCRSPFCMLCRRPTLLMVVSNLLIPRPSTICSEQGTGQAECGANWKNSYRMMTVVCIENCADVSLLMQGVSEWIQCGRPAMRILKFHGMTIIRRILQHRILLVAQTHGQVAHAKAMAFANGLGSFTHQAKPQSGLPVRYWEVLKHRTHPSLLGDSLRCREGFGPCIIKGFGRRIDRDITVDHRIAPTITTSCGVAISFCPNRTFDSDWRFNQMRDKW